MLGIKGNQVRIGTEAPAGKGRQVKNGPRIGYRQIMKIFPSSHEKLMTVAILAFALGAWRFVRVTRQY